MISEESIFSFAGDLNRENGEATAERVTAYKRSSEIFKKRFIAFDVETTGLNALCNRIIEVGAVIFEDGEAVGEFNSLINAGQHIPRVVSAINHITDEMLKNAPSEKEVYPELMSFLGDAVTGDSLMCAHNGKFDFSFLCMVLNRLGYAANFKYIDTLHLCRKYIQGVENYKQGTLEKYYSITNSASHRAASDAKACGEILCKTLKLVS